MSLSIGANAEKDKKKKRLIKTEPSLNADSSKKQKIDDFSSKESHVALFRAEEAEAESRNPEEDVELFRMSCDAIRKAVAEIRQIKQTKNTSAIESRRVDASMQFLILKKLNRLTHFRCRKVRETTSEAKIQIDQFHLQLQNLLYEVMHLQKEITKCLEFKSKDEEIELIPVEDFYKEAPEHISRPEVTRQDSHQLTLARLEWELEQRQQLTAKLKDSQASRETVIQDIRSQQEHLDSLLPKLNSILQATKPVQTYLNMPYDEVREQHQTAYHLPYPLYVLYMQASAYHEACDPKMKVIIEGDAEAAKTIDVSPTIFDDESDSDQEDQEKTSNKRRRKTVEARQSDMTEKILLKHPLSVSLTVICPDGSSLQLTFQYLLVLRIITVMVKVNLASETAAHSVSGGDLVSPDLILNELYPGDFGCNTPNPANQYELKRHGMEEFGQYIDRVGRPYLWAQWLGGLQFLGDAGREKAHSTISSAHMHETVKRLRHRLMARLHLLKQLTSLEQSSVPVSKQSMNLFPSKLVAQLASWRRSTFVDFSALPYTRHIVENNLARESDFFFTAVMSRGSAQMVVQIVITPDYPAVPPLYAVNLSWLSDRNITNDIHIQELEEEVNVHYGELLGKGKGSREDAGMLLSLTLQRLIMCLDVYLETEVNTVSGPAEIAREKVFPRIAKCPSRKKPFKYLPALGIFTHRC